MTAASLCRFIYLLALFTKASLSSLPAAAVAENEAEARPWSPEVAARTQILLRQLPPTGIHYVDLSESEVIQRLRSDSAYRQLVHEKLENRWFAALVATDGPEPYRIRAHFDTWRGLVDFLAEQNALVEVWACGEKGDHKIRRLPAGELGELKQRQYELPTLVTVTFTDPKSGQVATYQLEFSYQAAATVESANQAYQRHRSLQLAAHRVLGALNARGLPDAFAQWNALQTEIRQRRLPAVEVPAPTAARDVYVAFEFQVDEANNFTNLIAIYRASELRKRIQDDAQTLLLQRAGEKQGREVLAFRHQDLSDRLERASNPILGRDIVELRVKDPAQLDPRRWHVVEFGEPELLKQSALAHFAVLEAYLERSRKARAMQQANLALIAEPIIAGLNIGGGLAGLGFPVGESARLLYNLITWRLISNVPTTKQMRDLFALMAARDRNPEIKLKPERFLSKRDLQALREQGRALSDTEIQTYLEQMTDEDVRAMLRLARQEMIDARVTTFLNILTSAFKVSGVSDDPGPIRDIFNNVRFSMNGDINLFTLLMLAIGHPEATPLSGVSLHDLAQGEGPEEAWLQYLQISVDIRAVLNTIVRLTKSTYAKKELEKPFPYSPRMSELAAYEFRIFGFPLLLFYKRGLVKADYDAYQRDYAYGLRGVTVVEHFPTREAMEEEILAGRMFPLGLVRMPTFGGWKETDLVVYAHRIPSGKHRGKTALIIYGLRAYTEYSELIARELLCFREFERGLREGAVIEQQLPDQAGTPGPPTAFEPVIHVGADATAHDYNTLLSPLVELRRQWQRKSWNLPVDNGETSRAHQALGTLRVQVAEGDPLVTVDPYQSSFIYRCQVDGHTQQVKVTCIPSLGDIERGLAKADEAKAIEEIRRRAAAGENEGVVLLNEVREVEGHLEMGPLLHNAQGQVLGAGVISGAKSLDDIFSLINRLPVTDRARLRANHFAATAVELESDPKHKVFLTIEFPLGPVRHEWTNPLSGEREILEYEHGLWRKTVADRRIVEVDYDAASIEQRSRTYANLGNRQTPVRGALIEETRTLDYWVRDLSRPGVDPNLATIAKLHVNYVTGQLTRETFGLFPLPIETADDQFITRNSYNPYGIPTSSSVFENGRQGPDFGRPSAERVRTPILGRPRFELTARLTGTQELRDLSSTHYRMVFERRDLIKGLATDQTFDQANFGRKIEENGQDPFDGTQSFAWEVAWDYSDGFLLGQMPVRARTRSLPSGAILSEVINTAYDPLQGRLTGTETTYTGQVRTNTWDYRWSDPVEVHTRYSSISQEFNRDETETHSATTLTATGEIQERASGQYRADSRTWQITRQTWYRPEIPDLVETNVYSAFGRLIAVRQGDTLETRPSYTPDGIEQARSTFARNQASGRFDERIRQDDQYQWQETRRTARTQIFVAGQAVDEYRAVTDPEGRLLEDGLRLWPQCELRTVRTFEPATDRLLGAELLQNGQVRARQRVVGAFRQADGQWRLKVAVTPYWGLSYTNSYGLGDPLGRLIETEFETGERARVTAWFGYTPLARETELLDRQGHVRERSVKRLQAGSVSEWPFDLITTYRLNPWGDAGLMNVQGLLRGTEVPLFSEMGEQRFFFDLSKTYAAPQFAIDPTGHSGLDTVIAGNLKSNVTAVFTNRFREQARPPGTGPAPEEVLEVAKVDLRGLLYYPFARRTFDRAGRLLAEETGELRNLGPRACSDTNLFASLDTSSPSHLTLYSYQPAWVCAGDAAPGSVMLISIQRPVANLATWSVNEAGLREWPTSVRTYLLSSQASAPGRITSSNLVRVTENPRWLKQSPYLPGITNAWMAWSTHQLNTAGTNLFDSDVILDAQGEMSSLLLHKLTSNGEPATKIAYTLPRVAPDLWRSIVPLSNTNRSRINLALPQDLSTFDLVGFYLDAPATVDVSAQVRDTANHIVQVTSGERSAGGLALPFWPVGQGWVAWAPNDRLPEYGATVSSSPGVSSQAFVLSMAELTKAGIEVGRIASIELSLVYSTTNVIRLSEVFRLVRGGAAPDPRGSSIFYFDSQPHADGLVMHRRQTHPFTATTQPSGKDWNTIVQYEGSAVGALNPRPEPPHYPVLLVTDTSDPDSPRPLYALAAEDGKFLEYYQTRNLGDVQVYTVVSGFETPKVEIYRAGILDDEISPGLLGFGHGYYVVLTLAKGSGWLSSALAALHNRCVASAFALGGQRLLSAAFDINRSPTQLREIIREHGSAASQAQTINRLPTLAEALLPRRSVPWSGSGTTSAPPAVLEVRTNQLRNTLSQLSTLYPQTKLIPTSPGTAAERFVDTVQEAALIELAVKLRDPALANDSLAFYWEKSQGGTSPLHAGYDARTGASLTKYSRYKRPADAEVTARAQLAIAEAAFCVGTATGDRNALEFGRNLLDLLLTRFQPRPDETVWPRGIAESPVKPILKRHGLTLWPPAKTFFVASNARAYLLFSRLAEQAQRFPFDPAWRQKMIDAAGDQAAWLTNRILPSVRETGVVPKGLFEVQDVHNQTTALAVERWTTTDGWLAFLEAAGRLGIDPGICRTWLDNLARVQGLTIGTNWGVDWTIPLQRADAISLDLTARFLRVASLLGHEQAANFVRQNLARMREEDHWPAVWTGPGIKTPIETGQGPAVYPVERLPQGGQKPPPAIKSQTTPGTQWQQALGIHAELADPEWPTGLQTNSRLEMRRSRGDITQFFLIAAALYLAMVAVTFFWWGLSHARKVRRARAMAGAPSGLLVSEAVMRAAEERWAKRVLGMRIPAGAERTRYTNSAVEQNFHIQLRAIYKLVLEWRRVLNDWAEDDARVVEGDQDEWLNGLDEFAVTVGIYTRWVVKAGRKDGLPKADVLEENEDSNHIWSRLVMYFSESHQRLLALIKEFKADPLAAAVLGTNDQIELVLRTMGLRARPSPFDARTAFDAPANASALDLLLMQVPTASLTRIVQEMERKWQVPPSHVVNFIKGYKSFKEREQLYPVHPYLLEAAKILPHFCLMGLVGLIWYNQGLGALPIIPYLRQTFTDKALDPRSLIWAVPLFIGFALSVIAQAMLVYRYRWGSRQAAGPAMSLDADLLALFGRRTDVATPALRIGRFWSPVIYQRAGWVFRAVGLGLLAVALFQLEPPGFALFMLLKGMLGMLLLLESAGMLAPLILSRFSSWLQDRVTGIPRARPLTRFLNQLNIVPTRPASLVWLSIKYHFQPSVPTGGFWPMLLSIVSYLVYGAAFFLVGSYMFKQALQVWFQETYWYGRDLRLILGTFLFWNTMYLLRFGLFVFLAALISAAALYPLRVVCALGACCSLSLQFGSDAFAAFLGRHTTGALMLVLLSMVLMAFESECLAWLRNTLFLRRFAERLKRKQRPALLKPSSEPAPTLGVVYMSGDDLSFHKLTPELLMTRLKLLRDKLSSGGASLLSRMQQLPREEELIQNFKALYELEKRHGVTLWHPDQLVVSGTAPWLRHELGFNLLVETVADRERLLGAWHLRRWLVTMMSTAGHAQDTGINLVDIALALAREGLAANTAFYLIQNKYDNNDNNRPSQAAYDQGELGQRDKLARLLMASAPGSRAYSINDWTPFGFKAGGLVGMDLVFEESLKLTNMLILDRNANVHDLDALMEDLKRALADPGIVIIIPSRSTTNTLTPIGQSSQLIEEGQRALTRGVMLMGGMGGETLGTGWGNTQAIYYGRVQRALCDTNTSLMPLTTATRRSASFGDRCEGLIGFGPHAIGISEDIWGVTQAAHNALALGCQVKFLQSRAFWHKLRESWSHAEWFSAFPRWAGGYLQMMLDPIMQTINDAGPLSVFAKELRANGGRFFLSAPSALLSILLMPLAIICDVSPFVQILILLWNLGLIMNQVLTALGLVACLEATGFKRLSACAGGAIAWGLSQALPGAAPFALPLVILGFLSGGFAMGLGRWLYYRGRDIMLFGPQLVIHALGQVVRQSLEFVLSGASAEDAKAVNIPFRTWVGPREDRPLEGYQNVVNLRTVVWGVGLVSLALNLLALANLDFLNVLLLLPSLMFSVSTLVGPFLMAPKPGTRLGWLVWSPKLLGWLTSFLFYLVIAWLIAGGGWRTWSGVGLFVGCVGIVLLRGLRYASYLQRVKQITHRLSNELVAGGLSPTDARQQARNLIRAGPADLDKIKAALQKSGVSASSQASVLALVHDHVQPLLKQPLSALHERTPATSRFVSEFGRSFVLGMFTFVWFFVVPVPGLLVFTAPGGYRIFTLLSSVLLFALAVLGFTFAAGVLSLALEWWEKNRATGRGLAGAVEDQYRVFQALASQPGRLAPLHAAHLFALFTDLQTYFDQRSYAYAWLTLRRIQAILRTQPKSDALEKFN